MSAPQEPPQERGDAARNRALLLQAARGLVAERGADAVTMDDVAAAAGVGKGTLFRRFGSRAGLMMVLLDEDERASQQAFLFGPPPLGPDAPPMDRLVAFGRFAERDAKRYGKRRETFTFLGLTLYCTRNRTGNFKVGMRTEKSRLRRSLMSLQEKMRQMRHLTIGQQVDELNDALRGHYGYYGIAGNFRALQKVYRHVERY